MSKVLIAFVRIYQVTLSPLLGANCRFSPSCSQYTIDAIGKHGCLKGTWLAGRRLLRCQPFVPGGYDPVP